ncbi:hypothetical protein DPEC_G00253320 [Dallia pectoralis]|uniref:Uncharacterized protein n=1 Tax=Dallia pectoralis TaxID=75939 RepID=A0ACC2FTM9_DALPE|nr:hypothetical protein DPEC_G00253320 [Dallia pectoralis]
MSILWILWFLCLSGLVQSTTAQIFWMAYLETSFVNSSTEHTVQRQCECGRYGASSPLESAVGMVILPVLDPMGCSLDPYLSQNLSRPWIALVKRGNCTFSQKIRTARDKGASAVVVYNLDGTGNNFDSMFHGDNPGVVSIMIGNLLGLVIVDLVQNGIDVKLFIRPGNAHGPLVDVYWMYFLSIAFFIVTGASIIYFAFVSIQRLRSLRTMRLATRRLKNQAKKAIGRLEVRKLKHGDMETQSDSYSCAVCIESYRPGDVVSVLTCGHLFHKACIEPWLLDKRTCPMCKADILKALGVDGPEGEEETSVPSCPPPDVTVFTVSRGLAEGSLFEVPLNDDPAQTLNRPTRAPNNPTQTRQPVHYDNMGFVQTRSPTEV